jgi:hypothetical protein
VFPATIFDYNGVLVDDEVVHLEAFATSSVRSESRCRKRTTEALPRLRRRRFPSDTHGPGSHGDGRTDSGLIEAKRPRYLERARARCAFARSLGVVRRHRPGPVAIVSGALRDGALGLSVLGIAAG